MEEKKKELQALYMKMKQFLDKASVSMNNNETWSREGNIYYLQIVQELSYMALRILKEIDN